MSFTMLSSYVPMYILLSIPFQLLFGTSPVYSAVIPQPIEIATTNVTLRHNPVYCSNSHGWVGDGIIANDCAKAISGFYRTNVRPRGGQEFEFLTRGVRRTSIVPYILTPRKYDYGE